MSSLDEVSPFRRGSSVGFPKSPRSAAGSSLDGTEVGETSSTASDAQAHGSVHSADMAETASTSGEALRRPARQHRNTIAGTEAFLRPPGERTLTDFTRRPSTDPSSMSFVLFNLNDLYAKAREDVELERAESDVSNIAGSAPVVQRSRPMDIPKPGSLTGAAKVYPSMVEDERWFEEPWQLIQFRGDVSTIVSLSQAQLIAAHMPLRYRGGDWEMMYSTLRDGISLRTLYRKAGNVAGPDVLVIKDEDGHVFGGFTTDSKKWLRSQWRQVAAYRHAGSGQSFLFSFNENGGLDTYDWTGKNDYYMQAERHSLHMGLSEGHYGLWLDESLLFGHTTKCETFNNQPLTTKSDFRVAAVEVWRICY